MARVCTTSPTEEELVLGDFIQRDGTLQAKTVLLANPSIPSHETT